jgi:hypothetical protein
MKMKMKPQGQVVRRTPCAPPPEKHAFSGAHGVTRPADCRGFNLIECIAGNSFRGLLSLLGQFARPAPQHRRHRHGLASRGALARGFARGHGNHPA